MTNFFYNTEFLDDGYQVDLISIGIVNDEDDREYYAVNRLAPWNRIMEHEFLKENVVPHLPLSDNRILTAINDCPLDLSNPCVKYKSDIAEEVRQFLLSGSSPPQLWAWYAAYDHLAYAQLWGPMSRLPDGLPKFTMDLKQEHVRHGNPELPPQSEGEHHALADARYNLLIARVLSAFDCGGWPLFSLSQEDRARLNTLGQTVSGAPPVVPDRAPGSPPVEGFDY